MLKEYLEGIGCRIDNPTMIILLNHYGVQKWDELFYKLGSGQLQISDQIKKIVKPPKPNALLDFFGIGKNKRKSTEAISSQKEESSAQRTSGSVESLKGTTLIPAKSCSTIEITGIDGRGLLNVITRVMIETITANIINVHLECKDGLFKGYLTIDTSDVTEIHKLCSALKKIREVERATLKK